METALEVLQSQPHISSEALESFCHELPALNPTQHLQLDLDAETALTESSLLSLASALSSCPLLPSLSLSLPVSTTDAVVVALAVSLQTLQPCTFIRLDFARCSHLTDAAFGALGGLSILPTLRGLVINANCSALGDEGCCSLAPAYRGKEIVHLQCAEASVSAKGVAAVAASISSDCRDLLLNFGCSAGTEAALEALAAALHPNLSSVNFTFVDRSGEASGGGLTSLLRGVPRMLRSLRLDLGGLQPALAAEGVDALCELLSSMSGEAEELRICVGAATEGGQLLRLAAALCSVSRSANLVLQACAQSSNYFFQQGSGRRVLVALQGSHGINCHALAAVVAVLQDANGDTDARAEVRVDNCNGLSEEGAEDLAAAVTATAGGVVLTISGGVELPALASFSQGEGEEEEESE